MPYKPTDITTLKGAIAALIAACGGLEGSAARCRVKVTTLCRYQDPAEGDCFMPADVIQSLELSCRKPIVTSFLAGCHGAVLTPLERGKGDIAADFAALGRDTASSWAHYAKALADGRLSETERRSLIRDVDAVLEDAGRFRADLLGVPA